MVYTSLTMSSQQRWGIKKENLTFESLKEGLVISFSMYVLQPNPQAADGAFFLWLRVFKIHTFKIK